MDIQSSVLSALFLLYPVIVQGWVTPVRPLNTADGGIPKSLYDDQSNGLECLIDPWVELFNQAVAVDDRVDLFINNGLTPVDGKTISPGEENLRIRLYVPKGRLRDGINEIYYRVTRASGNGSEDSRKLSVLYHRWAPGEPAPDAIRLQIPDDVLASGVGPEQAARGVGFGLDYSNRRPYDFISLTLGSRGFVERELTPEEADPGVPLTQALFTDTFKQNPDNPRTPVLYSVTDQLGNFSQSATQYIDVHVNRVMLAKAILREIPTDNTDDPNTVDLAKLNGNPLSALIHFVETIWKVGDSIKLEFTAELNGSVVATHEETSPVTQVPSQFVWSIPNSKVIANSTVKVVYQLVRGGAVIATSTPATAQVIGEGAIKLLPAKLVAPAVNPIDLWLYLTGIILRIEFLAALAGDKAQLIEINSPTGATPFPAVAFNASKRTNTTLTQAFLAARHGKQITFRWALIRGGKEVARSGPLVLTVNPIVNGDTRFPAPVIAGQTGQELGVTKLVASDKLSIAPWPFQMVKQYVCLRYDGFNSSGVPIFFEDLKGVLHNEAQGLNRPVPLEWLKTLGNGRELSITFQANLSAGPDESSSVIFPVRRYTIKVAPAIPELIVDKSPLNLTGVNISCYPVNPNLSGTNLPGTFANRPAYGGVAPITFSSSDKNIASVDNNGLICSEGNGFATITVSDAAGQSVFIEVSTANVIQIRATPRGSLDWVRRFITVEGGTAMPVSNHTAHPYVRLMTIRFGHTWIFRSTQLFPPNHQAVQGFLINPAVPGGVHIQAGSRSPNGETYAHYFLISGGKP